MNKYCECGNLIDNTAGRCYKCGETVFDENINYFVNIDDYLYQHLKERALKIEKSYINNEYRTKPI